MLHGLYCDLYSPLEYELTNGYFMFTQSRLRMWLLFAATIGILASSIVVYAQNGTVYIVRDGETLTSIAQRYHTTVEALVAANHLANGDALYVGQRLIIPGTVAQPVAAKSSPGTYTVQSGDTLTSIANQYGLS